MNRNTDESTEHQTDDCVVWQPVLRTIFTKEDIAEIVSTIKSTTQTSQFPP